MSVLTTGTISNLSSVRFDTANHIFQKGKELFPDFWNGHNVTILEKDILQSAKRVFECFF